MRCLKKIIIGFGIFLPALLSVLFVSPSYATDLTQSYSRYDSIPSGSFPIPNCDITCIKSYSYLVIELPNSSTTTINQIGNYVIYFEFYALYGGNGRSQYATFSYFSPVQVFAIPDHLDSYLRLGMSGTFPADVTFTLTNDLPCTCTCPDPEPCPVVPENPYDNKLDNITRAIYTCGGILLVLYFFYCIYRIIIKNSGVSNL